MGLNLPIKSCPCGRLRSFDASEKNTQRLKGMEHSAAQGRFRIGSQELVGRAGKYSIPER